MDKSQNNKMNSFICNFQSLNYEVWTASDTPSTLRLSNDRVVVKFCGNSVEHVVLYTNSKEHIGNKRIYESIVRQLENLTQEKNAFTFTEVYLADAFDYYPSELISLFEVTKDTNKIDGIDLVSVRRTLSSEKYEQWRFLWNSQLGYYSEDHVIIEKSPINTRVIVYTSNLHLVKSPAFVDQLCGILNSFDSYTVYIKQCDDPFDLSVDEEIEQLDFADDFLYNKQASE